MNRNHSLAAIFVVLATSALGVILAPSIPNSVFPEIVFHRAIILADTSELPPAQMLVAVTRPLEEAAYGVVGTSRVRSTTTRGSSEIDIDFSESADPTTSYELLNAALGEVRARLPPDTNVDTRLLTTGTFPIIDMSLSSKVRNLAELTDVAFYDIVPSLHRIPGVYRVEMVGAKYREYVVTLDPQRMLAHATSPNDVVTQLSNQNIVASAGRVIDEHRMLLTVVTARLHSPEELMAVPVGTQNGTPIYIRDIATVGLGIQEDYIRTSSENGPAVLVGISRNPNGNTEAIAAHIQALIRQFRVRYPDVQFSLSYNQATLVAASIGSVRDAIILGLLLSILVVLMFTMSPLSAIVAAIVVPSTVAMTMVVMKAAGMSFNMMTLGGMAAGVGLFIDDAIVMIEAVHRAHATGTPAAEAVASAVAELGRPLIASTLTVIVVFMPLIFVSGVTGVFFRSLAVTMGGGLAISLFLALFFTPALEQIVGRWRRAGHQSGRIFGAIRTAFVAELRPFVRFPILAPIAFLLCIAAAVALYRTIGTDYLPPLDEGAFTLDYTTPPQSTLADTTAMLDQIEHILRTTPEVAAYSRRTGTQLGFFLTESDRGDMSVRLHSDRKRSINQVMESIRGRILATVPGVRVEFSQVLQDMIGDLSGTPEPIEVKVFGPDQATIQRTARAVAELLGSVPGAVDVFDGVVLSNPEEEIVIDEPAADRYGLSASDIQAALLTVVEGTVATSLMVGDRLIDVRVRYPAEYHTDLRKLSQVLLRSPGGQIVPLDAVAKLRWVGEQPELDRERMRPVIHVTGRLENTDLGTALAKLQAGLAHMTLAPGVSLELGGLYADQQKAFAQLGLVMVAALVATMLILIWEFGRLTPALGVLAAALASLAGSFAALNLFGITLNISSFMGVIMVAGITAKNGILLLDHAEQAVSNGDSPANALAEAAAIRIRPILMTTLATAAGLAPLALGLGAGAKVQQPLAIAVIGGLVLAMLLSSAIAGGIYLLGTRPSRESQRAAPVKEDTRE
ncbi:MAG TPA: efflux RND transporter permease subunit [Candidatus Binataceae bacterium]|nr:efflux RND transporter permease subunit [Candidatus Binataceae bacterium]